MRTISLERWIKTWFLTYPLNACARDRGEGLERREIRDGGWEQFHTEEDGL